MLIHPVRVKSICCQICYLPLTTHDHYPFIIPCSLPLPTMTTQYLLLLLTVHCLLHTTHCSLFITHYLLLTPHYSPLITRYSPLTTRNISSLLTSLLITHYSTHYLLLTDDFLLLSATCCYWRRHLRLRRHNLPWSDAGGLRAAGLSRPSPV